MSQENELETKEKEILDLYILMAGKEDEDILAKVTPEKIKLLKDLVSELERGIREQEACEVINRILSLLGIGRISQKFFEVVFKGTNFSKIEEVKRCIEKFRWLCLLEYSDILDGYDTLRKEDSTLVNAWTSHFSPRIRPSIAPLRLERVEPQYLFTLGYLAYDQVPHVSDARKQLGKLVGQLLGTGKVEGLHDLVNLAKEQLGINLKDLQSLCARAAIPEGRLLLSYPLGAYMYPYPGPKYRTYSELLMAARESCEKIDEEVVRKNRFKGLQNTRAYLSAQNIDVYMATSMRETTDFLTNYAFVRCLLENEDLGYLNLTFFDPTQAYIPERVHKGLLECLMIRRASVTIYNAQETETFGKDAEAAISLAHGKPVIIYVPRIFGEETAQEEIPKEKKEILEKINKIYSDIDDLSLTERTDFLEGLVGKNYLSKEEAEFLSSPEKDKRHAIEQVIDKHFSPLFQRLEVLEMRSALFSKGYHEIPFKKEELVEYCKEKIKKLEVRALLFRDIHPLSFQLSPIDGVARGVFVTRGVQETARLLRAIFEGSLEYEIKELIKKVDDEKLRTLVLCDKITNSPVRACPRNHMIRNELSDLRSRLHLRK